VNDYLREVTGGEFTAKDFRTWGGTVQAVAVLGATALPGEGGERAVKTTLAGAVKQVATVLGNTPAVCRASYIHPEVFSGWLEGELHRRIPEASLRHPRKLEALTLAFLRRRLRGANRSR
jgi:DNA topoisomerase I